MPFTLDDITYLASPDGQKLVERLATEDLSDANTLKLITQLRKNYAPEQARAALAMARLRLKAAEKFGDDASRLFFTREALEQASDPTIRQYRARRIADKANTIIDAGCGIGSDSLALAASGIVVHGLDIDLVRVEMARYNAAALSVSARFDVADVRDGLPDAHAVFFDPARRDEQRRRIYNVEQYEPPLSIIRGWKHPLIAVKLSPGVDLAQLDGYEGRVEFISVDGDLKEAVLWLGVGMAGLRATLLTDGQEYHWDNRRGGSETLPYTPDDTVLSTPRAWLVEPDPALIRAGLVREAAARFGGAQLDESIAYFTADANPNEPWARGWKVLDWMPFNLKKLRAYLNDRKVGTVTVKKRGTAVTPDELIPKLKLKGSESRTLVLTRCKGEQIVMICEDRRGDLSNRASRNGHWMSER